MPKLSQDRLRARRRGIVQAAARCLQRNGLAGTGMRDLFRAANLSPGAVYRYFASKEELIAAVAAASPSLVEAALATTGDDPDPPELLRRLLAAAAAAPAPARLQCQLEAAALHSPIVGAALTERRERALQTLGEAVQRPAGDALTGLALALCEGLARRRLLEPAADLEPQIAAAGELLLRALDGS